MKLTSIVLLLSLFTISLYGQPSASTLIGNACEEAKTENKNVFIIFTSSGCGWCKRMKKRMNDPRCETLFKDNYIIEYLTIKESQKNKHLETPGALDYHYLWKGNHAGLPYWVILNDKGDLLEDALNYTGRNIGCPYQPEEVEEFIRILKKTSNLKRKELNLISIIFRTSYPKVKHIQ